MGYQSSGIEWPGGASVNSEDYTVQTANSARDLADEWTYVRPRREMTPDGSQYSVEVGVYGVGSGEQSGEIVGYVEATLGELVNGQFTSIRAIEVPVLGQQWSWERLIFDRGQWESPEDTAVSWRWTGQCTIYQVGCRGEALEVDQLPQST